jgi:hypothetical protein
MVDVIALSSAVAVGWACFIVGGVILLVGAGFGALWSYTEPHTAVATATGPEKKEVAEAAKTSVEGLAKTAKEAAASTPNENQKEAVEEKATAAQSAVQDLAAIVKALPERLRFWGFLMLIGALLMSVATIEFSGHPIF